MSVAASAPIFSPQDWIASHKILPLVMGILNVTPDSFYEGGRTPSLDPAVQRGVRLVEEGADVLDVGGESTRPGAEPVGVEEELNRVVPVVEALARRVPVPISVDTTKSEVAVRAIQAGASIVNDISSLRRDSRMARVVAASGAPVILMHMQGDNPRTMQENPSYRDVTAEVFQFFQERVEFFKSQGGDSRRVLLDPGIGFGKNLEHNLALLRSLKGFRSLGCPLVLGASRKSFIGRLLRADGSDRVPGEELPPPSERLEGSLAVACWASLQGVDVLRVHDVEATRKALRVWRALAG